MASVPSTPTVSKPTTQTIAEGSSTIQIQWSKSSTYDAANTFYKIEVQINGGANTVVDLPSYTSASTVTYNYTIPAEYRNVQGTTFKFLVSCLNPMGYSGCGTSGIVTINKLSPPVIGSLNVCNPYVNSNYTVSLSGGSQTTGEAYKRKAMITLVTATGVNKTFQCNSTSNWNTSVIIPITSAQINDVLGPSRYTMTGTVTAWIENSRGTKSGTRSASFTVNINSDGEAAPTFSGSIGLATANNGEITCNTCVIAGLTKLTITAPTPSGRRGANSNFKYKFAIDGMTTISTGVGVNYATFSGFTAGTKTITVTAIDSRNLEVKTTRKIRVQSAANPAVSSLTVSDRTANAVKVIYSNPSVALIYEYADGVNAGNSVGNAISTKTYSLSGPNVSLSGTLPSSGQNINGLVADYVYTLTCHFKDKLGRVGVASVRVPSIKVGLALRKNTGTDGFTCAGVNCVPQGGYALEVEKGLHTDIFVCDSGLANSFNVSNRLTTQGPVTIEASPALRLKADSTSYNYATILMQDGANFYYLLTSQHDADGTWRATYPLRIANNTGYCYFGNYCEFSEKTQFKKRIAVTSAPASWINGGTNSAYPALWHNVQLTDSYHAFLSTMCKNNGHLSFGAIQNKIGMWYYAPGRTENGTDGGFFYNGDNKKFYINDRTMYRFSAGVTTNTTDGNACITIFDEAKMNNLLGVSNAKITNTVLFAHFKNDAASRVFCQPAVSGSHTDRWVIAGSSANTTYESHYLLVYYG